MEFIRAEGKQLFRGEVPILLRGFGLGGWFLPEGYMWKLYDKCDRPRRMEALIESLCGSEYAQYFWEAYFENFITENDIKDITSSGYNSVRMPLNARRLYRKGENGIVFDEGSINRLDRLIQWCSRWDIYVILDMHGAPGGQTGANIDDSENDLPELFMNPEAEKDLITLWEMLAHRYKDEPIIAGYDLLNEPLPNWFSQHNHQLMPLYVKLIDAIRAIDSKHLIILEGLHWATDFSLFEGLPAGFNLEGIVLEFHKYWSNPDKESLAPYSNVSESLNVPLFMGEGGENNLGWYTTVFPLYERLNISWNFWTYKKMACQNSPVTFDEPAGWQTLMGYIDGANELTAFDAIALFDGLIASIKAPKYNPSVLCALDRKVPVLIPAEAFDDCKCSSVRLPGADLRLSEGISIVFASEKAGAVDYKRYAGESQPPEENLLVLLRPDDFVAYDFKSDAEKIMLEVTCDGHGKFSIGMEEQVEVYTIDHAQQVCMNVHVPSPSTHQIKICGIDGTVFIDTIDLKKGETNESN